MSGPSRLSLLLLGAALALAGCSAVPTSSSVEVVHTVPVGQPAGPVDISPPAGADARTIVSGFLEANAASDPNHNAARSFLTPEEKNRWLDATGITVIDRPEIGNLVGGKVTVTGREIGTIDATGVYMPALRGNGTGTGGPPLSLSFGMQQVKGQWRIDSLQSGLLVSQAQFQQYQQRALYFFDVSEEHLVPDPRYTQLTDSHDLAAWLVAGLARGPRGGLQTGLPNQSDPKRVQIEFPSGSAITKVEIPGAGQLDTKNRDRLSAQLAGTLAQAGVGDIEITDGGRPVRIPAVGGNTFSAGDLTGQFDVTPPDTALYYIHDGAVLTQSGRRVAGRLGAGSYDLTSVAMSPAVEANGPSGLLVAGVRGTGTNEYLDIGTTASLVATRLHGELSRPAWAPDVPEVWIGAGANLYRVSPNGTMHVVPVDAAVGKASGTVIAVRLSPEGSRVALVLKAPDGSAQIYIGAVVRGTSDVRVADLAPISPQSIAVNDVAWNDQLKLFAIGTDETTGSWGLYEVQCDGSLWTLRNNSGLPQAPDSLTVAAGSVAVVSAGDTVWEQQAGSWG
ncbi:MAG TPA: LpqB family beta-propeller domain-containing protein, partial [Jatrophihabitantaceae bacterium]